MKHKVSELTQPMKTPRLVIIGKRKFFCPPRIQRCDSSRMHGWQVRYKASNFFSDKERSFFSDGSRGPRASFMAARHELNCRYLMTPPKPASSLRHAPLRHKQNDLPAGISGPVLQHRRGRAPYASFKVSLPVRGRKNVGRTVHIGTERTYAQKYHAALAKAVRLRKAAVAALTSTKGTAS